MSRTLRGLGFEPRIIPAIYVRPFIKGQKNDYNDAEAIAEAALRPNLKTVTEKSQDQLDLQALHRVRSRLVSRRTATINQIRAFLIEQGITVRKGLHALKSSFLPILEERQDEISPRMRAILTGLYGDWLWLDERIETVSREIEDISRTEENCANVMTIPGIGPLISTALVAAIGRGEAFDRGRDFAAWIGLIPRQYSTGGRTVLGRISKRGSRYLRMLFVQAANVVLMRPHRWPGLQLWRLAGAGRDTHASKQAGYRSGQQTRPHRLECTETRDAIRRPKRRGHGRRLTPGPDPKKFANETSMERKPYAPRVESPNGHHGLSANETTVRA